MSNLLTADSFDRLRSIRATSPSSLAESLVTRRRRPFLTGNKRVFIIAADHAGRGAFGVGKNPLATANRYDLLARVATALSRPGVDGVIGTPDILEDLAVLGVLEEKIAVGSMNRGGLHGASFEMDDRFTAYDSDGIVEFRLDCAKLLLRINLRDRGTVATLEHAAQVVTRAAHAGIPIMIEPLMSTWSKKKIINDLSANAVIASMAIASGLGNSSAYSWLTLPVVPEMERVMDASTLPVLLLGGDPRGNEEETYAAWSTALAMPGVHGLVAGRSLLYPPDDDVIAAVDAVADIVHGPSLTL